MSHTGALAGADRMYDALFRQVGVIRAQTFADLLDIPAALATGRVLRGNRVAILTSTGGAGTLVSDSLGMAGFDTPAPDAATAAALRALQTGDHAVLDRNPIDVTLAGLQPDLLRGAIDVLLESPSYDALTIIVGSSGLAMPELHGRCRSRTACRMSDKPVHRLRQPARAGGRRAADAARRAGVRRGRELHRGARRRCCRRAASKRRPRPAHAPAEVSVDDLPVGLARRGAGQAAVRPLRRALRAASASSRRRPRPRRRRASSAAASC